MRISLAAILCAGLLAACGGGDSPTLIAPHQTAKPLPAVARVSSDGAGLAVGPAFLTESPDFAELPAASETNRSGMKIRSGRWRDAQGRDGSHNASEVVRFLRSYQTYARQKYGQNVNLRFVDFGEQKTLRTHGATEAERELVSAALQEINTALPWDQRILLGDSLASPVSHKDIPNGEIHLQFTSGRGSWPDGHGEPGDPTHTILGLGSALYDPANILRVRAGFAFVDRDAISTDGLKQFVIAHEVLHAYGIGAHADPSAFPNSIMAPTAANFSQVPPVYLSIDGEGLLAESHFRPGRRVASITAIDLGPWTDTAFHLVGYADLQDADHTTVQFGAGLRNGLSKPWAFGPAPDSRLRGNPAFARVTSATWNGGLLGFSGSGKTVAGDARIRLEFASLGGTAGFSNLEQWPENTHPGKPGSGQTWGDGDLGYTIKVTAHGAVNEGFQSVFAPGDDPGVVTGAFVGAAHEGAAGVLEHPDLSAAFGGTR